MTITARSYEFRPPSGGMPIKVHGIRRSLPGQGRVQNWRLEVPAQHAAKFDGNTDFENWTTVVATLAHLFCAGDTDAASALLILKFDDGRFGGKPGARR
jgi:hypothetical protein